MKISLLVIATAFAAGTFLSGCGAGPPSYDRSQEKQGVENATAMKSAYDAAGGDFSKVPPDVKADLEKRYGSPERVQTVWKSISEKLGATPPSPQNR